MKKTYLVLAILAILILAGCAKQPTIKTAEEPVAAPAATEEVTETTAKVLTTEVKDILERADKKVDSFSYLHSEPPGDTASNHYFVKETKIKVELYEPQQYDRRIYFDTVYIDTTSKTAVGYCEDKSDVRCPDKNRQFDVKYSDYFKKTPYMWLKEITYAEKVGEEQIDQKDVDVLQYEDSGKIVKVWINSFYGIPLKVEVTQGKSSHLYLFSNFDANKLDEEDVVR
jgi:hypothetical protein